MKKKIVLTSAIFILSASSFALLKENVHATTTHSSSATFVEKQERMNQRLEKILTKVDAQVQARVTEKVEAKKVALAEANKKAAEEKASIESVVEAEEIVTEQSAVESKVTMQQQESTDSDPTTETSDSSEAISGESDSSWQEYKEKGQEYGNRLSDPNLTPEQRREIIDEKIDYYKNH